MKGRAGDEALTLPGDAATAPIRPGNQPAVPADLHPAAARRDPAIAVAHATMQLLLRHGISPTPDHYQLVFACQSPGGHPAAAELEALLGRGETSLHALHERHFSRAEERDQLSAMSDRLGETLVDAAGAITGAADDARSYGETLRGVSEALEHRSGKAPPAILRLEDETRRLRERGEAMARRFAEMAERTQSLRDELEAARREADSDALTGLPNRRAFDRALAAALRGPGPAFLLLLDLDHFKAVNDRHGHAVGDLVLAATAAAMRSCLRPGDTPARLGGEELAVVLEGAAADAAGTFAETLREAIAAAAVSGAPGAPPVRVTASLGLARAHPGESPRALFERADRLLYEAKQSGRNRTCAALEAPAMSW